MKSVRSSLMILSLTLTVVTAAGIGKAWEVSPIQKTDKHSLPSRPWLESSAFEVRSVSGIGRLSPTITDRDESPTKLPIDEDFSSSREEIEEIDVPEVPKNRQAKELEDLSSSVFVPARDFNDPTIDEYMKRSKETSEVEAFPRMWRKFRRHGRTGSSQIGHCSEVENVQETEKPEKPRIRRETGNGGNGEPQMEKIGGTKSVRQGRLDSPDSWSKQPLSVEFRARPNLEEKIDEEKLARATGLQAPRVDFVTSNRRSFNEHRESRDMPTISRSYEEMPIYRNTLRDLESTYTRGLFYPERYRTERDYFVRSPNEPSYQSYQNRYRDDFDLYSRSRPIPKPKRIIYYATLPEIVRKPVDLRNYPRPYPDTLMRSSNPPIAVDGYHKRRSGSDDPMRYRYYSQTYENPIQNPFSRPNWNDRPYVPYAERMEDSRREIDLDHASLRNTPKNEESMLELTHDGKMMDKSNDQDKTPWAVQIGTEVSVKDNERITGRKIFGQRDVYDRFRKNPRDREPAESANSRN